MPLSHPTKMWSFQVLRSPQSKFRIFTILVLLATAQLQFHVLECAFTSRLSEDRAYIQIPEPGGLYYYPYQVGFRFRHGGRAQGMRDVPVYVSGGPNGDELGKDTILLKIHDAASTAETGQQSLLLRRNKARAPSLFVYNVEDASNSEIQTQQVNLADAEVIPIRHRFKRSPFGPIRKLINKTRNAIDSVGAYFRKSDSAGGEGAQQSADGTKKVIHLPALFIDKEKDGFEHVFYRDMIVSALCLTNWPDLDRHEIRDEYEARVCNNKGYASILPESVLNEARKRSIAKSAKQGPTPGASRRRKKRDDVRYQDNDADKANWHLDRNKYDILWRNENASTSTSTARPAEPEIVEDLDYEYEFDDDGDGNETTGWEDHEVDPEDLDFIAWPAFLPVTGEETVNKSDQLRSKLHNHPDRSYTLAQLYKLLQENHTALTFDRRKFALNDSSFLADYYTSTFHLWSYDYEGLIEEFFTNRNRTLLAYSTGPGTLVTLESIRQLFILYVIDVHHVNCFNRHIRFYGYVMKRSASINGDQITNSGRLTRGIVMRALELLRHVPQYNIYKELFLRMLIAALKERAASVKHSTKLVEENDYTELYEVAKYLEYLLKNGIHPDDKNQDLFVQETRFYAHHFMNTLTL